MFLGLAPQLEGRLLTSGWYIALHASSDCLKKSSPWGQSRDYWSHPLFLLMAISLLSRAAGDDQKRYLNSELVSKPWMKLWRPKGGKKKTQKNCLVSWSQPAFGRGSQTQIPTKARQITEMGHAGQVSSNKEWWGLWQTKKHAPSKGNHW